MNLDKVFFCSFKVRIHKINVCVLLHFSQTTHGSEIEKKHIIKQDHIQKDFCALLVKMQIKYHCLCNACGLLHTKRLMKGSPLSFKKFNTGL